MISTLQSGNAVPREGVPLHLSGSEPRSTLLHALQTSHPSEELVLPFLRLHLPTSNGRRENAYKLHILCQKGKQKEGGLPSPSTTAQAQWVAAQKAPCLRRVRGQRERALHAGGDTMPDVPGWPAGLGSPLVPAAQSPPGCST